MNVGFAFYWRYTHPPNCHVLSFDLRTHFSARVLESLVSPSWRNEDQLYCHCSSLSLLEVGESSSPQWQNRKKTPAWFRRLHCTPHVEQKQITFATSVPCHFIADFGALGAGGLEILGLRLEIFGDTPSLRQNTSPPNHFSTDAMERRLPTGWFLPPSNVVASPKAPRTSSRISFTMPSYLCENSDGMAILGEIH